MNGLPTKSSEKPPCSSDTMVSTKNQPTIFRLAFGSAVSSKPTGLDHKIHNSARDVTVEIATSLIVAQQTEPCAMDLAFTAPATGRAEAPDRL